MSIFVDTPTRLSRIRSILQAVTISQGRVDVNPNYIQDVDGNYVLDIDGNKIFLEDPTFMTDVDDEWVLDVDNKKILVEGSEPYSIGSLTPFSSIAVACLWVTVTAYTHNYRDVFVGGPGTRFGLRYGSGNLLSPGQSITFPSIDDVSKVFIHGYVTDGVYFTFGQSESQYLGDTDGFAIADTDSVPIS